MSEENRTVAGRYQLTARIGGGAMGVVWRGRDDYLDRVVAIKELLLQEGLDEDRAEDARTRAIREGRIAARLHHPHAITVFDVVEEAGRPWLIMEYLPSKSLAAVLTERGRLPVDEVVRIGRQLASALAAAHDAGIVHRDVKPGNVLLGSDGTVKVTDFGIARAAGDSPPPAISPVLRPSSRRRSPGVRAPACPPTSSRSAPRSTPPSRAHRRSVSGTTPSPCYTAWQRVRSHRPGTLVRSRPC